MISRLTIAAAVSLLACNVLAQSNDTPSSLPSTPPSSEAATEAGTKGITAAKSAEVGVRFNSPEPADIMSSNLVGIEVFSKQNDKLGKIEDLAIEGGKIIKGLVVSVGGFLGVGEKYVLVDPANVIVSQQDGKWKAFVDMSKDGLKGAPEFKYNKKQP
jgi:sporulation protein YlmC with PRC-barrel domain